MQTNTAPLARYTRFSRWLHWMIFATVLLAYAFINLRGVFPRGSPDRRLSMEGHILAGLAVLLLVVPRLWHRLRHAPPPLLAMPAWQSGFSRLTHFALYLFLVAQPLLGLATEWSEGPLKLPFGLQVPSPLAPDRTLAESIGSLHGTVGTVFYYVIGLHIAAALWHHFVRHDDTLRRMI